ncbi:MAG: hypothetical protein EOO69_10580 [Moraxellaceae bacterium]|nr:MAG: hypothetical protein EOO69_10580 [Moraxellaceae bacterium]
MTALQTTRKQWLDAYYSGDHHLLKCLETDDFFIQQNHQLSNTALRYQYIERSVQQGTWQPARLLEKDIQFKPLSATEYKVTGVACSDTLHLGIEEYWRFEKDQWRVAYLKMLAL